MTNAHQTAEALDVIGMTWYLTSEDGGPVPVVRITVEVSPLMADRVMDAASAAVGVVADAVGIPKGTAGHPRALCNPPVQQ